MLIEHFGEQTNPDYFFNHFQPHAEEGTDPTFIISKEEILSLQPEIEEVQGLNNITYETYKVLQPEVWVFGEICECNRTYWYEKETLVKIKQLNWWRQERLDGWKERIIEDTNIPQLISPSPSTGSYKDGDHHHSC